MIQDREQRRWGIDAEKSFLRQSIKQANSEAYRLSRQAVETMGERLAELICRYKETEPYHSVKKNEQF